MSEPYLFPMEFSGDPCRNMMVEVVLWSGYRGRRWESDREECLLYGEKMKKIKIKERSKWVAGQESKDSCEMCGWGEWGRWGHTCGSLKYLIFFIWFLFLFLFFLFTLELSWGVTKGAGLALVAEEKWKEKRKKKKKREMGWVGCGASCQ